MRQVAIDIQQYRTTLLLALVFFASLSREDSYRCIWAQDVQVETGSSEQIQFFESRIHKVLVEKCYKCHSGHAPKVEGGLLLDSRASVRAGGDSGPAVIPGSLSDSLLFQAITAAEDGMPPEQPLSPETIADFRQWIESGAADPRNQSDAPEMTEPDLSAARNYWAFCPLTSVSVPPVQDATWPKNAVDRFVLAAMEDVALRPAPAASPEVLVRRVYFDLIGLPPTPAEVDAFASSPSEQAYRDLIDELLQRPAYGERWAQHWLDVVRYAETEGFEYDQTLPDIWRYRDYVIRAFNEDKPYDQFLFEQIAGDEAQDQESEGRATDLRIATGFFRLGAVRRNAGNQKVASSRNEVLTERTDILGSAVMGLTIGCARCHDHKFDPLSQKDYYRLQAFVAATHEDNCSLHFDTEQAERLALNEELDAKIASLKEIIANLDGDEEERVRQEIAKLIEQKVPPGPTICAVKNDFVNSPPVRLLRRGDPTLPGGIVEMQLPSVLYQPDAQKVPQRVSKPRTQLVHELLQEQSALIARVMVNRVWQGHFGSGLVSTSNDFGKNGSGPSHPELLEYLSGSFIDSGWQLKALHRTIMLSATYRQSSRPMDANLAQEIDPSNRLISFFSQRRLSGEELRDAMLAVSGKLNLKMGGESIMLPVEQELIEQLYNPAAWVVNPEPEQHARRSIYLFAKRNLRLPFMEVFDQPAAQTSCAVREQSTHARQALELLNGQMTNELAESFAQRLRDQAGSDPGRIVETAFQLAVSRQPTSREFELACNFLQEGSLREFALAMFNINAFLYVD
ncbi:MAG: PSD1 and planctomycete cytochrome C domain-containing protein [Pirellulaceae bacterium]